MQAHRNSKNETEVRRRAQSQGHRCSTTKIEVEPIKENVNLDLCDTERTKTVPCVSRYRKKKRFSSASAAKNVLAVWQSRGSHHTLAVVEIWHDFHERFDS